MTSIPNLPTIGQAFAITGLTFVVLWPYFFRTYSQVLDYAQILYAFNLVFSVGTFSSYLNYSFVTFIPNFLNYCTTGDFSCNYGYLLSPAICWVGATIILLILVKIVGIRKKQARFQPVYNFWKGLLRWTLAPLVFFSTKVLISGLQASPMSFNNNQIASVIVLAFLLIYTIIEVIGYKIGQKQQQNIWKKWIQYFSHLRISLIMVILVIQSQINSLAKYFIYGPLVIYTVLYLWKYKFTYKIVQRLIFFIQEAIIITLYSVFIFASNYIDQYLLDFYGLAIVIALQIILFFPKLYHHCKKDGEDANSSVNPEVKAEAKAIRDSSALYNQNEPNLSYQNLNQSSVSSPRRRLSQKPTLRGKR